MIALSVVIAVYRSGECLEELNRQLLDVLERITPSFEIVYVEDHGGDGSWELIKKLATQERRIKGVKFCRNFGQHYALSAGLDIAEGAHVVLMDCDLQDRPAEIERLYAKAQEGYDVVLARRVARTTHAPNRLLGALYYRLFDFLTGTHTDPAVGTFRILSRRAVLVFRTLNERHRFVGGMIQWMGFHTAYIDVPQSERFAGKSSYSLGRRLALAVDGIFSFSNKPLTLMAKFGALQCVVTSLLAGWIVYLRISDRVAEIGYASIMLSIFYLSGIIMLSVGVLGAYVGRIYDQVKARPYYIIEQTTFDG
jgi:glycosyltransferase involved in cell wall biosynthesis